MPKTTVQIRLDDDLLAEIDAACACTHQTRTAFLVGGAHRMLDANALATKPLNGGERRGDPPAAPVLPAVVPTSRPPTGADPGGPAPRQVEPRLKGMKR